MRETILKIEGMKCKRCKSAVEKALMEVPGVSKVEVDLDNNQALVAGSVDEPTMVKAVNEAGFKVVS